MERLTRLLEALRVPVGGDACARCREALDEYVEAQLDGQEYVARFPQVATHLDGCLECSAAYARLYEVELAAATGQLPRPARVPAPDLSFLPPVPSLADALRAALSAAGERLTFHLSPLLLGLLPPPVLAPVRSGGEERYSEMLFSFQQEAAPSGFPLSLAAYRDALNPGSCLVEVSVHPPGRGWPDLAGIPVTLTVGGLSRLEETDAWGMVSFEGVPVEGLDEASLELELG